MALQRVDATFRREISADAAFLCFAVYAYFVSVSGSVRSFFQIFCQTDDFFIDWHLSIITEVSCMCYFVILEYLCCT